MLQCQQFTGNRADNYKSMEIIEDLKEEDQATDHHNQRILAKRSKRLEFVDDDQEIVRIENSDNIEASAENANKKKTELVAINSEIRSHTALSSTYNDHNHTNYGSISSRNIVRRSGGLLDADDHRRDSGDNYNCNENQSQEFGIKNVDGADQPAMVDASVVRKARVSVRARSDTAMVKSNNNHN